jgi:Chs5-Arf1p-binding protein BUD7/BCH1
MLGELALRLHHRVTPCSLRLMLQEEAEEAFRACLDTGFSAKAWRHLLPIYESRHQTSQVLICIAKLTAWNLRWYAEVLPFPETKC